MKICLVVGHFFPHVGGVEKLFLDFAKGLKARGEEVRVITSNSGGVTGKSKFEGIDVYYYNWKIIFGHPIPKKRDLEEHVIWSDIVHTTPHTVANPTRKVAKKFNKPILISIHEVVGDRWNWIEQNKLKAIAFSIYEKYVCCKDYDFIHTDSDSTKYDYFKYCGKRDNIERIYLSVDNDFNERIKKSQINLYEYFNIDNDSKVVLYFGRPGKSKGIFIYLEAIKIYIEKYGASKLQNINFCFILANDPIKEKNKFISSVKKYKLDNIVKVKPSISRNDLLKCISESEIVVVPSITEGFGLSAAETCALGKKIIYSDAGSLPEVVSGKCLKFKNRDSQDLADKLYMALTDDNAFENIPQKFFEINTMINQLIESYKKII